MPAHDRYRGSLGVFKATKESEAGILPKPEEFAAMGNWNAELVKAGVLLAAEGLAASSKGVRVKFSGDKRSVIDGPFTETKELVAGFSIIQVKSLEEAIECGKARSERLSERRGGGRDPQGDGCRGFR